MKTQMSILLLFLHSLSLSSPTTVASSRLLAQNNATNSSACPLEFDALRRLLFLRHHPPTTDIANRCQYIRQGLRLVKADYLRSTGNFLLPIHSAESCWDSYQKLVNEFSSSGGFDIRKTCEFHTSWITEGCMNISTRRDFEATVSKTTVDIVAAACNESLEISSPCSTALFSLQSTYLAGDSVGNESDCTAFPSIYAAGVANHYGPTDKGTAKFLFSLDFTSKKSINKQRKIVVSTILFLLVS